MLCSSFLNILARLYFKYLEIQSYYKNWNSIVQKLEYFIKHEFLKKIINAIKKGQISSLSNN